MNCSYQFAIVFTAETEECSYIVFNDLNVGNIGRKIGKAGPNVVTISTGWKVA